MLDFLVANPWCALQMLILLIVIGSFTYGIVFMFFIPLDRIRTVDEVKEPMKYVYKGAPHSTYPILGLGWLWTCARAEKEDVDQQAEAGQKVREDPATISKWMVCDHGKQRCMSVCNIRSLIFE